MTVPLAVHRLAARWHVNRSEDELVKDYIQLLRNDNKTLREARFALRAGFTPSGWYVLRRVLGGAVLAGIIGFLVLFFQYASAESQALRARSERAARSAAPAVQAAMKEKRELAARATELRDAAKR